MYFNFNPICILTNVLNTTEDKKLFIAEAVGNDSFANILDWNQKIQFGKWFNATKSSKNIKDAWVSVAYLTPSVYDNGAYLLNSTSQFFTKQNFTFVVDTGLLPGDCDDNFRICGYDYSVTTQKTNSSINATLKVKSEYLVDRYQWVTHCDLTGCWVTCDYYRTDNFKDSLGVSDAKKIKYQNFTANSNYSIAGYYNGLAELLINASNSNVHFQIGNSTFDKQDYTYRIRYEIEPYNVLVKELVPLSKTTSYGLSILESNGSLFHLLAPYSENCSLVMQDHFNSKTVTGCNIPNFQNNSKTLDKVKVTPPQVFDSLLDLAELALAAYIIYQIAKKVMPHA